MSTRAGTGAKPRVPRSLRRRLLQFATVVILLPLGAACGLPDGSSDANPPPSPPSVATESKQPFESPRDLVLVTIDTLRADRLGVYGYDRGTSPFIDSLARESVVFENAIATCPATGPATASLLTGVHRASHGVARNGAVLSSRVETLAETLGAAGFRTAGFIANPGSTVPTTTTVSVMNP